MNRLGITLASAIASGLTFAVALTMGSIPPAAAKVPSAPTLLTPAAGAVVPANPEGITVTFDCPGFALNQYGYPNFLAALQHHGRDQFGGLAGFRSKRTHQQRCRLRQPFKTFDAAGGITSEVVGRLRRDRIRMSIDISKLGCTALGNILIRKR